MSHVEEVEIQCKSLEDLKVAVDRCGGELIVGQTTHAWWGSWLNDWRDPERSAAARGRDPKSFGTCEHAIRVKGTVGRNGPSGPWEVGVVAKGDGYALVYDNYGGAGRALESAFGKDMLRVVDEVAAETAMRELIRDGWRMSRTVTEAGEIVLRAEE